jgi:hypothetical protein
VRTGRPPTVDEDRAARRIVLEVERTRVRLANRFGVGSACSLCGATHPAVLVSGSDPLICYGCRVPWDDEGNHTAGHAQGSVIVTPDNEHRVFSEGERIGRWAMNGLNVPNPTAFGLGLFVGLRLGRLGTLGGDL